MQNTGLSVFLVCCAVFALFANLGCPADNSTEAQLKTSEPKQNELQVKAVENESSGLKWSDKFQSSLDRAVKWILENQFEDGRWGHFRPTRPADIYLGDVSSLYAFGIGSSSLCSMALLDLPSSMDVDNALIKGYKYLVSAPEVRRVAPDTFYNVWSHAYMIEAFAKGLKDSRLKDLHEDMKKRGSLELGFLLRLQAINGGFGYYDFGYTLDIPSGELGTTFTTATVLVALKNWQECGMDVPQNAIDMCIAFLKRLRYPNGAYAYAISSEFYPQSGINQIRGSIARSQAANDALFINGNLESKDVKTGLDDFFKEQVFLEIGRCRQYPHEAWYGIASYFFYYGHYYASRNLSNIGEEFRNEYAHKLAELIVDTQLDDGSFWDFPIYGYTKAYGTGFAVCTLNNCRKYLTQDKKQ